MITAAAKIRYIKIRDAEAGKNRSKNQEDQESAEMNYKRFYKNISYHLYPSLVVLEFLGLDNGDGINFKLPTMGGKYFWDTKQRVNGYKLQVHKLIPGHSRILDEKDIRIAWGETEVMRDKFRRIVSPNFLLPGDIIGVSRGAAGGFYDHYAIYMGDGEVIHYAAQGNDFSGTIHQAPIEDFIKEDDAFFVLHFGEDCQMTLNHILTSAIFQVVSPEKVKLYSPEETMERAKSRLGEDSYGLLSNNCEHFALWCKTGVSESHQIVNLLNLLLPVKIPVRVSYQKIHTSMSGKYD